MYRLLMLVILLIGCVSQKQEWAPVKYKLGPCRRYMDTLVIIKYQLKNTVDNSGKRKHFN